MASETSKGPEPQRSVTDDPLVWIDCEMTGLNPDTDEILEIYCIITTGNLEVLDDEGYHAVVHWPASRLDQMDEWCTNTHANSGLTAAVLASSTTPEQAAAGLYDYITRFVPEPRKALLAGNSVHADRAFLRRAPYDRALDHLHYRLLDVTSIKEAARRWAAPRVVKKVPSKKGRHQARDDILESIEEARYYRDAIFAPTFDAPTQKQQQKQQKQAGKKSGGGGSQPGRQMIPSWHGKVEGGEGAGEGEGEAVREEHARKKSNADQPGYSIFPPKGDWRSGY